ncbi:hypothetical protein QJS63_23010 [Pseudomonas juntendi]|nr:hypothetical protein QJS63_23010 [Pseudomonas juntendi]
MEKYTELVKLSAVKDYCSGTCAIRFARLIQADLDNLRHELHAIASGSGASSPSATSWALFPC